MEREIFKRQIFLNAVHISDVLRQVLYHIFPCVPFFKQKNVPMTCIIGKCVPWPEARWKRPKVSRDILSSKNWATLNSRNAQTSPARDRTLQRKARVRRGPWRGQFVGLVRFIEDVNSTCLWSNKSVWGSINENQGLKLARLMHAIV